MLESAQREIDGLQFRPARASDADACAPLVFASGQKEFGFFLGAPAAECIAFLRFAFAQGSGRFSFRRHHVAVTRDGTVCAVLAIHDGRSLLLDDPHVAWLLLRHFGVVHTLLALGRGLVLEGELPKPRRHQSLLAHCATHERIRSSGVFSALFENALRTGAVDLREGRQLVLDVLVSNSRAQALYRRHGFAATPRRRARSPRLPSELVSIRMALDLAGRHDGQSQ